MHVPQLPRQQKCTPQTGHQTPHMLELPYLQQDRRANHLCQALSRQWQSAWLVLGPNGLEGVCLVLHRPCPSELPCPTALCQGTALNFHHIECDRAHAHQTLCDVVIARAISMFRYYYHLLDNITQHGPQATIAVRAENLAYDVHDID